ASTATAPGKGSGPPGDAGSRAILVTCGLVGTATLTMATWLSRVEAVTRVCVVGFTARPNRKVVIRLMGPPSKAGLCGLVISSSRRTPASCTIVAPTNIAPCLNIATLVAWPSGIIGVVTVMLGGSVLPFTVNGCESTVVPPPGVGLTAVI